MNKMCRLILSGLSVLPWVYGAETVPPELAALKPLPTVESPVAPNRQSLNEAYPDIPEWYRDAKFGIYTHWGVPCFAAQFNDRDISGGWYGRRMYDSRSPWFEYHQKHWGDQNEVGYKDLMAMWKTPDFNADEWAELFAESGAKFAGPVAVHHDNYFFWDSDWHRWCTTKVGPKIDFSKELSEAIRKRGLKFMGSFHHGQAPKHFWHAHKFDAKEPGAWDLYTRPGIFPKPEKVDLEYAQKDPYHTMIWLNAVIEFINKYEPDLIYFEGGQTRLAGVDNMYKALAHYFNKANEQGREVVVTAKPSDYGVMKGMCVLDHERGREDQICADPWQTDTAAGSWFWTGYTDRSEKVSSDDEMIDMFIDIVSKNGTMCLNIPPDHLGNIPKRSQKLLRNFGTWLRVNGEAIYATRAWLAFGEGQAVDVAKGFNTKDGADMVNSGHQKETGYGSHDVRYTQSKDGKTLYAILLGWPEDLNRTLQCPKLSGSGQVELLGYGPIEHEVDAEGKLTFSLPNLSPEKRPTDFAHALKISGYTLDIAEGRKGEVKSGVFPAR